MTDPWDWRIYLHETHKNQPNVGVYTVHGSYGLVLLLSMWAKNDLPVGPHGRNKNTMAVPLFSESLGIFGNQPTNQPTNQNSPPKIRSNLAKRQWHIRLRRPTGVLSTWRVWEVDRKGCTGIYIYPWRIHGTCIFTYFYHKNQPNVGKYIIYMDSMGYIYELRTKLLVWGKCHHQMWGVPYRLSGFWMFSTSTSKQKHQIYSVG